MKNQPCYDYTANRWRLIVRTSVKHNLAEDIDGDRCKLSDLESWAERDYDWIDEDWKLLGAIACHCETPKDYDDARDMLTALPDELRPILWCSFPTEVQTGLKVAAKRCAQPNQEPQEGAKTARQVVTVVEAENEAARGEFKVGDRVFVKNYYGDEPLTVCQVLRPNRDVRGVHYFLKGVVDTFFWGSELELAKESDRAEKKLTESAV